MKLVVRVRLMPDAAREQALSGTLRACNAAANEVARVARERNVRRVFDLQQLTYSTVKQAVGGAQASVRTIKKVADAYATHRANLAAGNYGRRGTDRRAQAEQKVLTFRPEAAQPYDDRMLSWDHEQRTVSIWVSDTGTGKPGRIRLPFAGHPEQLQRLAQFRKGESDLMVADGKWFLVATLDLPDVAVTEPEGFLGVDLGIVQIATVATSTGEHVTDWSGGAVTARRKRNHRLRRKLQANGSKSAKRLLVKRRKKEARFVTDVNHRVSKQIVAEAKRTGRGIAVENLTGIRDRVRHRKPQRATMNSWAFAQLGAFLAYKAAAAGVAFIQVDPRDTSRTCSACHHADKAARVDQATYTCTNPNCGVSLNADYNAAINIARRGAAGWVAVNLPTAA